MARVVLLAAIGSRAAFNVCRDQSLRPVRQICHVTRSTRASRKDIFSKRLRHGQQHLKRRPFLLCTKMTKLADSCGFALEARKHAPQPPSDAWKGNAIVLLALRSTRAQKHATIREISPARSLATRVAAIHRRSGRRTRTQIGSNIRSTLD